jgi:hypothetical protein
MIETFTTHEQDGVVHMAAECEYCPAEIFIPLRTGPWQGWLPRDTFLCDDCYDMFHEED